MNEPDPSRIRAAEQSLETAIRAMGQALVDASSASHEIDAIYPPKDDQEAHQDRLLWAGSIADGLGALCTPKLRVLAGVLNALADIPEPAEVAEQRPTAH